MSASAGSGAGDGDRLQTLVEELGRIQREIEQVTSGQIDAVTLPGGGSLLMPGAQTELQARGAVEREVARQRQAILDALPAYIGVLDAEGTVVAANRAWREFGIAHGHDGHIGWNYLSVCDDAAARGVETARQARRGLAGVLARDRERFSVEYDFHVSPEEAVQGERPGFRAFRLDAVPLGPDPGAGAVAMHVDLTAERRAQASLRESERQHRRMFELSPLAKLVYDARSLRVLAANDAACRQFGLARDEFVQRSLFDLVWPDQHDALRALIGESADSDRHGEWLMVDRRGAAIEAEVDSHALDYGGRPARLAVLRDVTQRNRESRVREAESELLQATWRLRGIDDALRRFLERVAGIQSGARSLLMILKPESFAVDRCLGAGVPAELCDAFARVDISRSAGPTGKQLNVDRLVVVDDLESDPDWQPAGRAAARAGYRACWSQPVLDGDRRTVAVLVLLLNDPAPTDPGAEALLQRVSEQLFIAIDRDRQQRALGRERRLGEIAGRLAHVGGWSIDVESGEHLWGSEVYRIFERDADAAPDVEEGLGLFPPDELQRLQSALERLRTDGQPYDLILRAQTERGRPIVVRALGHAESDEGGTIRRLYGAIQDVTEQFALRGRLNRERRLLAAAGELGRIGGWMVDPHTQALHWSEQLFRILERPAEDRPTLKQGLAYLEPPARRQLLRAQRHLLTNGKPIELILPARSARGRRLDLRIMGKAEIDDQGRVRRLFGAAQDVTDQLEQQRQRHALDRRLRTTLENMGEGFVFLDTDAVIRFVNRAGRDMMKLPDRELSGESLWSVLPGGGAGELRHRLVQAIETGEPVSFETWYEPLQQWFFVHAYPIEGGLAAYFRVVTEERELQRQLAQAQRMDTLGQLTGGVAHDFNNLLTVIGGNAEILGEALADDDELGPLARMIDDAAGRGADLTRRLLAFARRQPLEPRPVALNEHIAELRELLEQALGGGIGLRLDLGESLWPVSVDPTQLESALLNLALNARDAMADGGTLMLETTNVTLDPAQADQRLELEPGDYVVVAVSDTGHGMDRATMDRIFDPFFTTKPKGQGTGLGLSMVYGFVGQSGGDIHVYSEPGRGTTFRLYLPRLAESSAAPDRDAPVAEVEVGSGESVLLVEDNELVREFAARRVRDLGYRVRTAESGAEALARLDDEPVDLLFTDVVMPGGIDGPALAERARELIPDLAVLLTSGYTEAAVMQQRDSRRRAELLSKPYSQDELARALRRALGRTRRRDGADGQ